MYDEIIKKKSLGTSVFLVNTSLSRVSEKVVLRFFRWFLNRKESEVKRTGMSTLVTPTQARKAINRRFSASSFVRQVSSSSWSSFKSAVSRNSSGSNLKQHQSVRVEVTVEKIRSLVMVEINESPQLFHENDVVKVKTNSWFIERFIRDTDPKATSSQDMMVIVKSIIECMKWRKEVGINDVKGTHFPKEFYDTALFCLGSLNDGSMMLYLTGRRFRRLDGFTDLMIEFFMFCYESQYENLKDGTQLMAMVDMSGVGLSSVDLPLFFKILTIVLKYYPSLVSRVFITDMSWMFKPIAKLVFAVLPNKIANMVSFVWNAELREKNGDKIPDFMGGPVQTYRIEPPPNCKSLEEVARIRGGISESQIKKAKKALHDVVNQIKREQLESSKKKNTNNNTICAK